MLLTLNNCITDTEKYQINNDCILVVYEKQINTDNENATYKVVVREPYVSNYGRLLYSSSYSIIVVDSANKFRIFDTLKITNK